MSQIVNNIRTLMSEKGWNAKKLAENSQQKVFDVYNILGGKSKKPSADKVEAIARALGVSTRYILYGQKGEMDEPKITDDVWDGLLYSDSMMLVYKVCHEKKINFNNREEEKNKIMKLTMRVYNYAKKRNEIKPDRLFTEDIIITDFNLD